jgi:hypothetical protein
MKKILLIDDKKVYNEDDFKKSLKEIGF